MASQSEIGQFADEKQSNKLVLTEEDQKTYENWEFINMTSYQNEVVEFLRFEEVLVSTCSVDAPVAWLMM